MQKKSVMVITGEVSGDLHAAAVVRAVRRRDKDVAFFGIGGDELKKAGMEIRIHARDMAVLGFSEVLGKYFFFRRTFRAMLALLKERKPDAVLLVDYPGFNLPFAKAARKLGFKVVYYICPQVWAWNRRRIPAMVRSVNRLIAIFPFEPEVFKGTGLKVDFVGHPLVEQAQAARAEPMPSLPWNGELRVAILPGSRKQEIDLILPVMLAAAEILKTKSQSRWPGRSAGGSSRNNFLTKLGQTVATERDGHQIKDPSYANAGFIIAAASQEAKKWIEDILAAMNLTGKFAVVEGRTRQVLRQAAAAWVCSGTATIETALMGCPMVVVYRVRFLTYLAGRMLIRVPFLGMVNIVAGRQVCPELLQGNATPEKLARAIEPLLADGQARNDMINELDRVRGILGVPGAEERAAKILLQELS